MLLLFFAPLSNMRADVQMWCCQAKLYEELVDKSLKEPF
jgi:hypothetical protein